jgi:hypothetical protein
MLERSENMIIGGTTLFCKNNHPMFTLKYDLYMGDLIDARQFEEIPPQPEPMNGQRIICHTCQEEGLYHEGVRIL